MAPPESNRPAPNTSYFTPAQYLPAGTAFDPQPNGKLNPTLFKPLRMRGVELQNRIWGCFPTFLPPLCQYSPDNDVMQAWQHSPIGDIFTRVPSLSIVDATSVLPEGRITAEDASVWNGEQAAAWAKVVEFAHSQGQKVGIRLAHAGRKASTLAPFVNFPRPMELTREGIKRIIKGFVDAAQGAVLAAFDAIEVHGAHGYLITGSFLCPTSNERMDEYGESFENRIRVALEVVDVVRAVAPPSMPLFFRVTASE
ncbi:hypothetical protein BD414DRAFT_539533 [Trametes punicea]|nr:hypothetical protein BD414DRAFT_539533 [Trametes punicea]